MKCKHRNIADITGGGDWPFEHRAVGVRCLDCRETLSLGPSNDEPEEVRIEIAAAGLVAGTLTGNDTDVTLDDPIAKEVLDWQLDEHGPIRGAAAQCDALYGVIINHHDRDERGA